MSSAANQPSYAIIACHVLWRELSYLIAHSPARIFPVFLEQGLHNEPDRLRAQVQAAIDRVDGQHETILIGYGLCSNGICGLRASKSRLVAIRAHDCITLLLGSRQDYQTYFNQNPGTYWYSAGWIETGSMPGQDRIRNLREKYTEQYDEETAEFLVEEELKWIKNYRKACFIRQDELPHDQDAYRTFTSQCASECGWQYDELVGSMDLLRDFVDGKWDDERFLVLDPGQSVASSYDTGILAAGN